MHQLSLAATAIDLEDCVSSAEAIWVHSGRCTVRPLDLIALGVNGFHAPPFSAPQMKLTFKLEVDGITLTESPWYVDPAGSDCRKDGGRILPPPAPCCLAAGSSGSTASKGAGMLITGAMAGGRV